MSKKPMRVLEGNMKPFEPFWRCVNASESESGQAEIEFYGPISEFSWMGDEITPAKFKKDLHETGKGQAITIRIHSPGGAVDAASAIRAMIMDYDGYVTTRIDGLCASAATFVALAGDKVIMQDSASFMIHNPRTIAIGYVDELKRAIAMIKACKQSGVETYQNKTGLDPERISKMMDAETWMTATEAQALGFVDEIVTGPRKKIGLRPGNVAILNCLENYANVPEDVLKMAEGGDAMEFDGDPIEQLAAVHQQFAEDLATEMAPGMEQTAAIIQKMADEIEEIEKNVTGEEMASDDPKPETEEEPQPVVEETQSPQPESTEMKKLRNYLDVFAR